MDTTYPTLMTVDEFRKLINEHFSKQINDNQEYDARDVKRFNEIDEYTTMFLQHGQYGTTFNETTAFRCFHDAMAWRKQNKVYDVSPDQFPASYFDRHAIFYKNRDINNNRVLYYIVRIFNKGQEDNEAVKRFIIYNFEEQIRAYPGQKIVIVFDMSETGLGHLDWDLIKFIMNILLTTYPGLLSYMLVYRLPFILQAAWRLIKTWMPRQTQDAVKFIDQTNIQQFISPDQLPVSMGGTASDEA